MSTDVSFPQPPSRTPPPQARLGKYRLLAPLAEGGMARVFVAQRDGASDVCVLKQLLDDLSGNEIAAQRFQREAHVSSLLFHPRIARVIDAGFEDNSFCIAMELIVGKDMESMMHAMMRSKRLLPYPVSLTAVAGVLEALEYAHNARDPGGNPMHVVHRDLSPRNMMLGYDGEARVIDFGMAKGSFDEFKTKPGMVLGTLRYVSPEQAQALPIDSRSDLYSVAVVLYEMLTGRVVVPVVAPRDMLTKVVLDVPPPVHEVNPTLSPALSAVVAKGLAKDPVQRWQSAYEFRAALLETVGDWAATPPSLLGEFMREQFPEDLARAERFLQLADNTPLEAPHSKTRTVMVDDLMTSRTPSLPRDLTESDVGLTTKTGLDFPMLPTGIVEPTVLLLDKRVDSMVERGPGGTVLSQRPVASVAPPPSADEIRRQARMQGVGIGIAFTLLGLIGWALLKPEPPTPIELAPPASPVPAVGAVGAKPVEATAPATLPRGSAPAADSSEGVARRTPRPTAEPTARPQATSEARPQPTPDKPRAPAAPFPLVDAKLRELENTTFDEIHKDDAFTQFIDAADSAIKMLPEPKRHALRVKLNGIQNGVKIEQVREMARLLREAAAAPN